MKSEYIQYGCGLSAPKEWLNFDVSPSLRIQKIPIIGTLLAKQMGVVFPSNVRYGDIIKGLPVKENSCSGVYCSHTLEHLSLTDFRKALENSYKILKPGGIFRCVVPDLEPEARKYIAALDNNAESASINFIGQDTLLGTENRPKGFKGLLRSFLGNANHLWMWDHKSMAQELKLVGFNKIRTCHFNDSTDKMFLFVEEQSRFVSAVAIECVK